MAAPDNKKKKCETTVSGIGNLQTPTWHHGMTVAQGRSAWFKYLREEVGKPEVGGVRTPIIHTKN